MKRNWSIAPKHSLRENAQKILPGMFDSFFAWKAVVTSSAARKTELHQMRIAGKPFRYMMETAQPAFGREFAACLAEAKEMLELLGTAHDCDVHLPILAAHYSELIMFNRTAPERSLRISTAALRSLLREQRALRRQSYAALCAGLRRWEREDFRGRLAASMQRQPRSPGRHQRTQQR